MASRPENVRLYCILPRNGSRAVIFRRGPSKSVLLVSWDLATDTFEDGQWLRGRIYERRCDLSPDGELLIYFAANWKDPYQSWTAVSRPPYLTALALWPKGDAWGGGGHFVSRTHIALNHRDAEMSIADGFRVPKWMKVTKFGEHSGWGEDNPIWAVRLARDGWKPVKGKTIAWEKAHPIWPDRYTLRMVIRSIAERNRPWYVIDHEIDDTKRDDMIAIERSDWADWSREGDLLYAQGGKLYRCGHDALMPLRPRLLQDFADREFRELAAPVVMQQWPKR